MKKLFLIITACLMSALLSAQVNYYVETTGDDITGDGSEATPYASVTAAFTAISAYYAGDANSTDYVVNVGTGTFTESSLTIVNGGNVVSVSVTGQGADETIIQGAASIPSSNTVLLATSVGDLQITLEDLTVQNYGTTSGGGITTLSQAFDYFTANRCVFKDIKGTDGALFKTSHKNYINLNECSFLDINGGDAPIINMGRGYIYINNCVFSNCVRDYTGVTDDNAKGIILHNQTTANWATNGLEFVNNTFVDCGVINGSALTTADDEQSLIHISWTYVDAGSAVIAVQATNNLFCGNTLEGMSGSILSDIRISDNSVSAVKVAFTDCTNNINTAVNGFPTTDNFISDTLVYTSPELDFMMDGVDLDYTTSSTGLVYVTAVGDSVVDQGLTSAQTATDILGTTRSEPGDIGAVEYIAPGGQFITFDAIDAVYFSEASAITLSATASSGLAVTYASSDESIAIVSGSVVTPVGEGKVTITASQAGDGSYEAADNVNQEWYLAPDTVIYYVSQAGDDNNNGLSSDSAFLTLQTADAAIVANETAYSLVQSYVVNVTDTIMSGACSFQTGAANDITIQGAGASESVIQRVDDATYDAASVSAGRVFELSGAATSNVTLNVVDLTIQNFGWLPAGNQWGAGAVFNQANDTVTVIRCVIKRGQSRSGTVVQTTNDNSYFSMTDCYLVDISSCLGGGGIFAPLRFRKGTAYVANCVFDGFLKKTDGTTNDASQGSVFAIGDDAAAAGVDVVIANNTVINCKSNEADALTATQCVLSIGSQPVTGVVANNLLVDNQRVSSSDVDIFVEAGTDISGLSITNNVMNAYAGFTAINDSSSIYEYDDSAINFTMDGDSPELFTTATGVSYVKPNGTSVYAQGLGAVAPENDITGAPRATPPSVGAYEAEGFPTSISQEAVINQSVSLYPNPVSSILNIEGDVTQVKLYNIAGSQVKAYRIANNQVDVSSLNAGVYFVECISSEGILISVERLIKK